MGGGGRYVSRLMSRLRAVLGLLCGLVTLVAGPAAACPMLLPVPTAAVTLPDGGGSPADRALVTPLPEGHEHHGHQQPASPPVSGQEDSGSPAPTHDHSAPCPAAVGCVSALAPVPVQLPPLPAALPSAAVTVAASAVTSAPRSPEPPPPRR
jgi:hypothetical protein